MHHRIFFASLLHKDFVWDLLALLATLEATFFSIRDATASAFSTLADLRCFCRRLYCPREGCVCLPFSMLVLFAIPLGYPPTSMVFSTLLSSVTVSVDCIEIGLSSLGLARHCDGVVVEGASHCIRAWARIFLLPACDLRHFRLNQTNVHITIHMPTETSIDSSISMKQPTRRTFSHSSKSLRFKLYNSFFQYEYAYGMHIILDSFLISFLMRTHRSADHASYSFLPWKEASAMLFFHVSYGLWVCRCRGGWFRMRKMVFFFFNFYTPLFTHM